MKKSIYAVMLALGLSNVSCDSMGPNAQAGTAIGALSGAAAGGIIAHNTGDGRHGRTRTLQGAAIGAAAGGLGGAAIGNSIDNRNGTRPVRYRQGYYQQGY